jgi:hypothetical protein
MAIVNGKAYWASVTTPNTTFEPVYTVDLVVSDEVAQEFEKRGVKVKDFSLKDESGEQQYVGKALTIKRKVNGKKGPRPAPKLVDRNKVEINTKVGNGSEVRVQYNEYPWEYAGKTGVSLDFQGMQVVSLVEMKSSDGDELTPFDDGEEF